MHIEVLLLSDTLHEQTSLLGGTRGARARSQAPAHGRKYAICCIPRSLQLAVKSLAPAFEVPLFIVAEPRWLCCN
jgi:hypothetical protein